MEPTHNLDIVSGKMDDRIELTPEDAILPLERTSKLVAGGIVEKTSAGGGNFQVEHTRTNSEAKCE